MLNPQPRPRTRKSLKAKAQRHAAKVVKSVRQQCVERDGYCVVTREITKDYAAKVFLPCEGPSQWCHMDDKKRFKTRGLPPEERHTTADSFMGCLLHHDMYDGRKTLKLDISPLSDRGADGPLRFDVRAL